MIPNWLLKRKELSQGAKLLYGRLSQFAGKNGHAFPGHKRLGEELGKSDRMIRKYLTELKKHRLVEWERKDRTDVNSYHFLKHEWQDNERKDSSAHDRNKCPGATGTLVPEGEDFSSATPRNHSSDKENQGIESIERESIKENQAEQIYQAYPRKVGPHKAKKKIEKALKEEVGFHELLQSVKRYAKCVDGKDPKFIPYPATWINEGRWKDDPAEWVAWKQKSKDDQNERKAPDISKITHHVNNYEY